MSIRTDAASVVRAHYAGDTSDTANVWRARVRVAINSDPQADPEGRVARMVVRHALALTSARIGRTAWAGDMHTA